MMTFHVPIRISPLSLPRSSLSSDIFPTASSAAGLLLPIQCSGCPPSLRLCHAATVAARSAGEKSLLIFEMNSTKLDFTASEKQPITEEQQAKVNEIRKSLGPLPDKLLLYCSDASITRHLIARNWNLKKATKMLKETLKWRLEYKPEEIRWEEVAKEAETGKIYRSNYVDKYGRSVLIMRPGCQNTKSTKGQIRYLVYCMENAILNLPSDQEQMVWLIDFNGFNLSHISIKVTKETAHVLQNLYPERLGLAILYNPPKFFEPFWNVAKPFLEPKTCKKVKFVYSDDPSTKKIMEDLFDVDQLECAFGGNNQVGFDVSDYAERMREDDKRMPLFWTRGNIAEQTSTHPNLSCSDSDSEESGKRNASDSSLNQHHSEGTTEDCAVEGSTIENGQVLVQSVSEAKNEEPQ